MNKSYRSKLRPCTVKGKKAFFHCWEDYAYVVAESQMIGGAPGGQVRYINGIIELENGQVMKVKPSDIIFNE